MNKKIAIILTFVMLFSSTLGTVSVFADDANEITGASYTKVFIDSLPVVSEWSASGSGYTYTKNGATLSLAPSTDSSYVMSDGSVGVKAVEYNRIEIDYYMADNTGIYSYEIKGNFSGTAKPDGFHYYIGKETPGSVQYSNKSGWTAFEAYVDDLTGATTYSFKFVYNSYDKTYTFMANNEDAIKIVNGSGSGRYSGTVEDGVEVGRVYFELADTDADPVFNLTDVDFTVEKTTPAISSLSYSAGGTVVNEADWADGKLASSAESVIVNLTAPATAVDGETTVVLSTDDDVIPSTYTVDGSTITVTPADGFAEEKDYTVTVSNFYADGMKIASSLTKSFSTASVFTLISPTDKAVFKNVSAIDLTVALPTGFTAAKYYIDGNPIDALEASGSVYTRQYDISSLAMGDHIFEAEITYNGEVKELSSRFELAKDLTPLTEVTYETAQAIGGLSQCEGADGSENGGIQIAGTEGNPGVSSGSSPAQGFTIIPNLDTGDVFFFEADVKRSEGQGLVLEAKQTSSSGTFRLGNTGSGRPIILTDGTVNGSDKNWGDDEWHKLTVIYDCSTGNVKIYMDGECVTDKSNSGYKDCIYQIMITNAVYDATNGLPICLDNIKYGEYNPFPMVEKIQYLVPGKTSESTSSYRSVSASSEYIKLSFNAAYDSITSADITVNGVNPEVSVSDDGLTVTLTPAQPLTENGETTVIIFSSNLTVNGTSGTAYQLRLPTNGYNTDEVLDFKASDDNNKATATIKKKGYNSSYPASVTLCYAIYANGTLLDINLITQNITANALNAVEVAKPLSDITADNTVKVFILSDTSDSAAPLCKPLIIQQN